jgi:hypothetical protein
MDHNQAIKTQAVERYLLGLMPPEQRDAFEEHYFTCADCAEEVRMGARFRAAARRVLEEPEAERSPRRSGWSWFPFPFLAPLAAALLLGVVIFQNGFQIPALKRKMESGAAISSFSLREVTRGTDSIPRIPAGTGFFAVYFDLPSGAAYPSYECTLEDSNGRTVQKIPAPAPKPRDSMNLLLNGSRLTAGQYTISVRPAPGSPGSDIVLARLKFLLE